MAKSNPYKGGQLVQLKSGKEVFVDDIRGRYIITDTGDWYHIDDIIKVLKER